MTHPATQIPGYWLAGQAVLRSSRNHSSREEWLDVWRCVTCGAVVLGSHPVPPDPDNDLARHARWHAELTGRLSDEEFDRQFLAAIGDSTLGRAPGRIDIHADSAGYIHAFPKRR